MKYVYYDASTKAIKIIGPVKEVDSTDPYIEVEDSAVDDILIGKKNILDFLVNVKSRTKHIGQVTVKEIFGRDPQTFNDWLFLVPIKNKKPDFIIEQNIKDKTIKISLSKNAAKQWVKNKYFGKTEIPIIACNGVDPHRVLWTSYLSPEEVADGKTIVYNSVDTLRFYTHRIFEEYTHEQHS